MLLHKKAAVSVGLSLSLTLNHFLLLFLQLYRLGLLAFAFLLALLKLSESARPCVSPLDDQAAFVRHHAALAWGDLVVPEQQVLFPRFDLGTFAGHVFGADPQKLVPAADAALALLVDGDDVDREFPPFAHFVCLQDVHLDSCNKRSKMLNHFI